MGTTGTDVPRVHAETRGEWRAWLAEHHQSARSVWLVTWKKHTGKPAVSYDDAVSEALAVGWVDSKGQRLDDDRTMLFFTPRKPGSGWSGPNKVRIAALERDGLMTETGAKLVADARADGSWSLLDDVENLVEPPDLAAALDAEPEARGHWDAFPRSARRALLLWVLTAKRPETRERRITEIATRAAIDERANGA